MPKDLTVTALAMWGLFALGVIVGTCYCYYSDNHIDEKLGVRKGKIKLSAANDSGVFYSLKYMLTPPLKLVNISTLFIKEKL